MRDLEPPLYASDNVVRAWLAKYAGGDALRSVQNAGHLEQWYGARIRAEKPVDILDGQALMVWLCRELSVSASARVCVPDGQSRGRNHAVRRVSYVENAVAPARNGLNS